MGLRLNKHINLGNGTKLNLSKSGLGISTGIKGARVSVNKNGVRESVGIPGSGVYYSEQHKIRNNDIKANTRGLNKHDYKGLRNFGSIIVVIAFILFAMGVIGTTGFIGIIILVVVGIIGFLSRKEFVKMKEQDKSL